jgi:hypothetical protein
MAAMTMLESRTCSLRGGEPYRVLIPCLGCGRPTPKNKWSRRPACASPMVARDKAHRDAKRRTYGNDRAGMRKAMEAAVKRGAVCMSCRAVGVTLTAHFLLGGMYTANPNHYGVNAVTDGWTGRSVRRRSGRREAPAIWGCRQFGGGVAAKSLNESAIQLPSSLTWSSSVVAARSSSGYLWRHSRQ